MNALALALLAVEVRARAAVVEQIERASAGYAGYLQAVVADGAISDGNALNSRADLHQALTMLFTAAQRNTENSTAAAYTAATVVARNALVDQLARLGHDVPEDLGDLGATLTALTFDVQNAFGRARTEIQRETARAFDGVAGDNPTAARQLAVQAALTRATARLRQRIVASITTAVHQGARDAQTAIFRRYAALHGYATVRKQWKVTSKNPCGMCKALHGTTVDLTSEFDRQANHGTEKTRPVYIDLQGPPRHPNCRCQIELVVS